MEDRIHRLNAEQKGLLSGYGQIVYVALTATVPTYQMKVTDQVVSATSTEADATGIVTLPSLAEAFGKFYYIEAPTGASAGDISVYEKETGAEISTYGDLDADNDFVILFSTGKAWKVATNGVA